MVQELFERERERESRIAPASLIFSESLLQMTSAAMMRTMTLVRRRKKMEEVTMKKKEGKRQRKPRWKSPAREGQKGNGLQVIIHFCS